MEWKDVSPVEASVQKVFKEIKNSRQVILRLWETS